METENNYKDQKETFIENETNIKEEKRSPLFRDISADSIEESEINKLTPISELNGAVKIKRKIVVGDKLEPYEYYYQTESGPCAALTFMNLWSLVHKTIPNLTKIDSQLINNGTNRTVWTENFSSIHGNNPNNEEFKFSFGLQNERNRLKTATGLIDYLDTIKKGSIICGTKQHCNAIHKWSKDQYVLVEPNDLQGLKPMNKEESINYIKERFTNDPNYIDYFYFIGPDINLEHATQQQV